MINYLKSIFKNSVIQKFFIVIIFIIFGFVLAIFNKNKISQNNHNVLDKIIFVENKDKILANKNSSIIYIWATWCGVCKTNQPLIKLNYQISSYFNINFISLEEGEDLNLLKSYLSENKLPYPVGLLTDEISNIYEIKEYPSYIYLDKSENVVLKESGLLNPLSFLLRIFYLKLI
jgi:thiol-disulfide isomerase/thioredoxin